LTLFVGTLLAVSGGVLAAFSLYLLTLALASFRYSPVSGSTGRVPTNRLDVVVPAHDEEMLIGRCVDSMLGQTYPRHLFRVIVIADNCTDSTAAVASAAGAEVMIRDQPNALGKGRALRWAMDRLTSVPEPPDAIVVVDADSVADAGLLSALERELAAGHSVVQGDYAVLVEPESPRSAMIAAGFLLFHRVRFSGRARLGMAANLVGNGMLFSRSVLAKHPWDAFTGAEDLEYSMHLAIAGVRPRFAQGALVSGPGPATRRGAVRQRLRWEGGRFYVVRTWLWMLFDAAIRRRDPGLLSTAFDLATPPLGMLCIATAGGFVVSGAAVIAGLAPVWATVPWVAALVAIPAFVVVGLRSAGAPAAVWRVVFRAPEFLMWKIGTYVRLLRGFDANRWERSDRLGPLAGSFQRVNIAGVPIDPVDMTVALSRLRAAIGGTRLFQVATINLDFVVSAQNNEDVRRIYQRSDLNLADGAPVVWLGRLRGAKMPGRVAGADLVPALLADASRAGARVFLLGGEGGAATAAAARLRELYPGLVVAGAYEPQRAAVEDMDNDEILERIGAAKPDLLLVAFGHPKQERWIDLHRDRLPVAVAIGVGCVFDLIAGRSRRAPRWMQEAGLEWFFRLAQEPRRLIGRYILDAAWLIPITLRTLRSRLRAGPAVDLA
jgi:exopolysaccharide biosynthesis WecB/TagA/CpsF family protein